MNLEDVDIMWRIWWGDKRTRTMHSPEDEKMNRRFHNRFREIFARMDGKEMNDSLDERSEELFRRVREEWDAIQPHTL